MKNGHARRRDPPRAGSALIWAVASAELIVFALFARMLAASSHPPDAGSFAHHDGTVEVPLLLGLAVVCGLWPVAPGAWRSVRRGRPDGYVAAIAVAIGLAGLGQWLAAAVCSLLAAAWLAVKKA